MRRILLGLLVVFFFFDINGPSKSYGLEKQISLTEAVKTALKENHEIRAAQNQLFAQKDGKSAMRLDFFQKPQAKHTATG